VGNLIEALNWTRGVARLAAPLTRAGRLQDIAGASFSMAFFSGVAANSMLAEAHAKGRLSRRELVLANLFNSMPTYFLHLPTMFFVTVPFLGRAALLYVGLTFTAAILRTVGIVLLGRVLLPPLPEGCITCRLDELKSAGWKEALARTWERFVKRIRRVVVITVPIYVAVYLLGKYGFFEAAGDWLASRVGIFAWLPPEALPIVVFNIAAETVAGLATAGALLDAGTLPVRDVVMALLVGNILSTPMRAFRHQFPYYAGIFSPSLAGRLIVYNQLLRVGSLVLVGAVYYFSFGAWL